MGMELANYSNNYCKKIESLNLKKATLPQEHKTNEKNMYILPSYNYIILIIFVEIPIIKNIIWLTKCMNHLLQVHVVGSN